MDFLPCTICQVNSWKYKCPVCGRRTCSLECSKKHKILFKCTGIPDPAQYIDRTSLISTPHALNRDYKFLQQIGRRLELKRKDDEQHGVEAKRFRKNTMVRNGVTIKTVPFGMDRARHNRSGWNSKKKRYIWTVEWKDLRQENPLMQRREFLDTVILQEALGLNKSTDTDARIWLEGVANLEELDRSAELGMALNGKTVVEFPSLFISGPELPESHKREVSESSEESDTSSSDDSDDTDSDGDDKEKNGNTSSDEEPEEVPIRSNNFE